VWRTGTTFLACVGPGPGAEGVVRSAARLAAQLGADWHAVYVETPALQRLDAGRRARTLDALKLARDLGAVNAVLSGDSVESAAVDYARSHNLGRIALGRGDPRWPWQATRARRIARLAPDVELLEVAMPPASAAPPMPAARRTTTRRDIGAHGVAVLSSVGMALALTPTVGHLDLANIAMLFLLVVLMVAVRLGRGPSVTATCVSVACFDFFFVPPRFTFAISDVQYLIARPSRSLNRVV